MKRIQYIRVGGLLLLAVILLFNIVGPSKIIPSLASQQSSQSVSVTIYLTTQNLKQIFQDRVSQMLSQTFSDVMKKLPVEDHDAIVQMATTFLQPSASLTELMPQHDGLNTTIKISLYPGDSQPINASMQIKFQVASASMVQVSVTPLPGSPTLVSGSVASIQIPFGQLSAVATTPACGASALALKLLFPLSVGSSSSSSSSTPTPSPTPGQSDTQGSTMDVSVGIPASSLAEMGASVGSIAINSMMTAKDITITVQQSMLNISTNLYWGALNIGSTSTDVEPTASGGKLTMHVLNTSVKLLQVIPFPLNTYNQQLEQTLNTQLSNAIPSTFSITQAGIGPNTEVPCGAGDSLLMTGSASLGGDSTSSGGDSTSSGGN